MKKYIGEIGLLTISIIWGSGFVGARFALEGGLTPIQTLTLRFFMATVILGVVFYKKIKENISKQSLIAGAILGVFSFWGFAAQTIGLSFTTASKNAFITAINVVIVPFIGFFLYKRKLDKIGVFSSILALAGIAVLSLKSDFSVNIGDFLTFLCAFGFAFHIFFTGEFTKKYDAYVLTVMQFLVAFLLSFVFQFALGEGQIRANRVGYMGVLYLGIFSTCIAFLLQTKCQSLVEQTRAAIILCMESVFGTILSVIILHEVLTPRMLIGCIMIFVAIIICETKLSFLNLKRFKGNKEKVNTEVNS